MWPSIISADRAEVGWWAGWGQPNWFPDQSSLHILMSKASPMPFANQTKVFFWNFKSDNRPRFFFSRMLKEKQPEYLAKSEILQSHPLKRFFPETKLCAPFQLQENCGRNHANSSFGWKVYRILCSKCSFVVCAKHSFGSLRPKPCPKALHLPGGSCCEADSKLLPPRWTSKYHTSKLQPVKWHQLLGG